MSMLKTSIGEMRKAEMYLKSFQLKGNDKLLDYGNYRYAQFNTRAIKDCPFASKGCLEFCYANKGCHVFANVKAAREKSYNDSLLEDFAEKMIFTIESEILYSRRYFGNVMILRLHESGDFYNMVYLKKWIKVFKWINENAAGKVIVCFYTKSSPLFNRLSDEEKAIINDGLEKGTLAISASLDDTFTMKMVYEVAQFKKTFPLANVYFVTNHYEKVKHEEECDCANCAKCGHCIMTSGKTVVVKIH